MSAGAEDGPATEPLQPAPGVAGLTPYSAPRPPTPIDLHLDRNEGATPPPDLIAELARLPAALLRSYPDARALEAQIGQRWGLAPDAVLVTAGADDAMERACRAVLSPGRELVLPVPTFEMLERFARAAGAEVRVVPHLGPGYPTDAVLAASGAATGAVGVITPNNPTGAVANAEDLRRLSDALPHALLLVDLAYGEFADEDLTAAALERPNAVVFRTLSKAWGLAGLRVGYALGPPRVLRWLRAVGLPYATSGVALALAGRWLEAGGAAVATFVDQIRAERAALTELLVALGAQPLPSQANFVLAHWSDDERAAWVQSGLAGLGIAVRRFAGRERLAGCLRITCPGDRGAWDRLESGLRAVLAPEALLFDMDGVLVDVSASYREAIRETAASYGVALTPGEVSAGKAAGDASNDWELTRRLLAARGVSAPLDEVTARFEACYQGSADRPGLRERERLIPDRALLGRLSARVRLGIVTGRPRADAERALAAYGLDEWFGAVICMEDGPGKPDPAPVRTALTRLGVRRAWMIGDTPDDMRAARAAGVVPVGVVAPGEDRRAGEGLLAAGAGRVLGALDDLERLVAPVTRARPGGGAPPGSAGAP